MNKYMFVYGSLMYGFYNYDKYLAKHVISIQRGYVQGSLYDMPYKGYPALLNDGDDEVWGEIIEVLSLEDIIDDIDDMENYFHRDNDEYQRIPKMVHLEDGEEMILDVYVYVHKEQDDKFDTAIYIPDGDWRKYKSEIEE